MSLSLLALTVAMAQEPTPAAPPNLHVSVEIDHAEVADFDLLLGVPEAVRGPIPASDRKGNTEVQGMISVYPQIIRASEGTTFMQVTVDVNMAFAPKEEREVLQWYVLARDNERATVQVQEDGRSIGVHLTPTSGVRSFPLRRVLPDQYGLYEVGTADSFRLDNPELEGELRQLQGVGFLALYPPPSAQAGDVFRGEITASGPSGERAVAYTLQVL